MIKFEVRELNKYPQRVIYKGNEYKIIRHLTKIHKIIRYILVKEEICGKNYLKNIILQGGLHYNANSKDNFLYHEELHNYEENINTLSYCFDEDSKLEEKIRQWILTYDLDSGGEYEYSNNGPDCKYPWNFIETFPSHNISPVKLKVCQEKFFNNYTTSSFKICNGIFYPMVLEKAEQRYLIEIPNKIKFRYEIKQFILIYDNENDPTTLTDVIIGGYHSNSNPNTGQVCRESIDEWKNKTKQELEDGEVPGFLRYWNFDDGYRNIITEFNNELNDLIITKL